MVTVTYETVAWYAANQEPNLMRFMVMVMARAPDVVIGRTRDVAQSRLLAVAIARIARASVTGSNRS